METLTLMFYGTGKLVARFLNSNLVKNRVSQIASSEHEPVQAVRSLSSLLVTELFGLESWRSVISDCQSAI
jgi:macrodomain Ter protein organizer (MatP/YcbG family)